MEQPTPLWLATRSVLALASIEDSNCHSVMPLPLTKQKKVLFLSLQTITMIISSICNEKLKVKQNPDNCGSSLVSAALKALSITFISINLLLYHQV